MTRLILILAVGIAATIWAGCTNRDTRGHETDSAPATAIASLQQQKLCADQADKSFKESSASDGHGNYTNHFDATAGVCYIETTTREYRGQDLQYSLLIYDAFEGRVYGAFETVGSDPKPLQCSLKPRDHAEIVCTSDDEFNSLALKYFGTTPD